MAVHFKFKSAKDYETVTIEGQSISVKNLKSKIFKKKNPNNIGTDGDLIISDPNTNEEYIDPNFLIPRHASVLVRRVPRPPKQPNSKNRNQPKEQLFHETNSASIFFKPTPSFQQKEVKQAASKWGDDCGKDVWTDPDRNVFTNREEEDDSIKTYVDAYDLYWKREFQVRFNTGKGDYKKGQGRRDARFGSDFVNTVPPEGYICHRCKIPGHYIQHCPTNGDPDYDIEKVRTSSSRSRGPVKIVPDEAPFEKEMEGFLLKSQQGREVPPHYLCPICGCLFQDAVLMSRCCLKSYCDKCIRDRVLKERKCLCGEMDILADHIVPNKTLRDVVDRFMAGSTSASSGTLRNWQGNKRKKREGDSIEPLGGDVEMLPQDDAGDKRKQRGGNSIEPLGGDAGMNPQGVGGPLFSHQNILHNEHHTFTRYPTTLTDGIPYVHGMTYGHGMPNMHTSQFQPFLRKHIINPTTTIGPLAPLSRAEFEALQERVRKEKEERVKNMKKT